MCVAERLHVPTGALALERRAREIRHAQAMEVNWLAGFGLNDRARTQVRSD
jgi:hypothetical protein